MVFLCFSSNERYSAAKSCLYHLKNYGIKTYEVKAIIDDWIDYYNNERYQWKLAKLSPNEYYTYITTGVYPLKK